MSISTSARPERILKDLGKLWIDLAKQDPNGVLRACAMTLVAVVEESEDTQDLGEIIAALMHEHPSRAIVLRVSGGEGLEMRARVFAQCWMPFGRRQQICCESIEITSTLASLADIPAVVRGLLVPDLPVVLYCPSENLWKLQGFKLLLPLATKLILDSHAKRQSIQVPEFLNSLARATIKADLAWSRLTAWRDSISRIFDDPTRSAKAYELEEVRILYSAVDEPASVYYLAAWFTSVLGGGVKVKIAPGAGPELASIARIELSGPELEASLELMSGSAVELRVNGIREHVELFPSCSIYDALRQELAVSGRDRIFEDVLGLTQLLRGKL